VYLPGENVGRELFFRISGGREYAEGYVGCFELIDGCVLVLTSHRLLRMKSDLSLNEIVWQCSIQDIDKIEISCVDGDLFIDLVSDLSSEGRGSRSDADHELSSSANAPFSRTNSGFTLSSVNIDLKGLPVMYLHYGNYDAK
jgi:hypothetical protein